MRLVPLDLLGINLDIPFIPAQSRRAADLEKYAAWLCHPQDGLGLRPDQVRLRTWDDLFGYEMVAQFFGDNGLITRTPDRIKLMIRNVRTGADWELVRRVLVRFYTHLDFPPSSTTSFSANVHSRQPAADELTAFFRQFPQPAMSSRPVLFSYVKINDWEADIRILIEKSNALPDALFFLWETQFPNRQDDWESFIGALPAVLENSAHLFDVAFLPMQ